MTTVAGQHQFDLYFAQDATTVSFTAWLPDDVPLPLIEGDVVDAQAGMASTLFSMGMLREPRRLVKGRLSLDVLGRDDDPVMPPSAACPRRSNGTVWPARR